MSYAVKEMFLTLQGEGIQAGRRAVFIRFAGCNLWSGREEDRADAQCRFCDTDFVGLDGEGGGRFADAAALADRARAFWDDGLEAADARPFAVITGGEPTLQLDADAIAALHARGFEIAIETNGTNSVPAGVDWICVSPKAGTTIVQTEGDELKLVWPQPGLDPAMLEGWNFRHRLVQPMDGTALGGQWPEGGSLGDTRQACIDFVLANPRWRLSVQTHKMIGVR
ncbi:7-carboxy-7-deazaguanine synthase [Sphingomonas sp.]|uniref:7-carboxy-7-deazaguanine synthase n=1 Tax=Sphingomonas sp. TaxID=28214 RepID=UPI000DB5D740|nr:7-carboxy-7-deazaguanine synthase [Sphingomonas sp.]PZU07933.1 MAG: 7-carboxy-7-deazaguanine synthase [Sphingomonas sp.]